MSAMLHKRGSHMRDVLLEIAIAHVFDRSDAGLAFERLLSGEDRHPRSKVRIVLKIERNLAGIVAIETRQPVLNIGGIADLRRLSIAYRIDANLDLLAHRLRHAFRHDSVECATFEGLTMFAFEEQVHDR